MARKGVRPDHDIKSDSDLGRLFEHVGPGRTGRSAMGPDGGRPEGGASWCDPGDLDRFQYLIE